MTTTNAAIDVWFGPGAQKGVFGAGVALGLQESIDTGEVDASQFRLYGSSIGCLTAAFLASGNAGQGLQIFQEETRQLAVLSNLMPALAVRGVNGLIRVSRLTDAALRVPNVLNLDHVFGVMEKRTPDIVDQLRRSPMQAFAETVDRHGRFRYAELRSADKPLDEIRSALNFVPFTHLPETEWMDSAINGFGFADLLLSRARPLVVVLNTRPTTGSRTTLVDLTCAALSVDRQIGQLYLRRRKQRYAACQEMLNGDPNVLLTTPPRIVKLNSPSAYEDVHKMGREAAGQIVEFLRDSTMSNHCPKPTQS